MNKTLSGTMTALSVLTVVALCCAQSLAREAASVRTLADVEILVKDACCQALFVGRNAFVRLTALENEVQLEARFDVDFDGVATPARLVALGPLGVAPNDKMSGTLEILGDTIPSTMNVDSRTCNQTACRTGFSVNTTHVGAREFRLSISGNALMPREPLPLEEELAF